VRDWHAVLHEIHHHFDPHYDFVMIPKVPLDTLDFTSYKMNLGSKMIVDATRKSGRDRGERGSNSQSPIANYQLQITTGELRAIDRRIQDSHLVDNTLLIVKAASGGREIMEKLVLNPRLSGLAMVAVVSDDVDIHDKESYIWGIFTRFDCERDMMFTYNALHGISPVYKGVMGIDATWKPGYPAPLTMPEEVIRRVDEKWGAIWK
jgi:3-polyprenyl-4-hydroxybenzoate decarboxylase